MKIGGIYIRGISKRFWIVLGGVVLLIFISSRVLCSEKPSTERFYVASPTPQQLASSASSNPDTLEKFISNEVSGAKTLRELPDEEARGLADELFVQQADTSGFFVYRLRVYIPEEDSDNGLEIYRNLPGWEFYPAIPLGINSAADLESVKETAVERITTDTDGDNVGEGIFLGFRKGNVPTPGETYEVTGLLYTSYQQLAPEAAASDESLIALRNSPVFLADSAFRTIKDIEVQSPADYRAQINIPIVSGDYQVDLRYLDWPSGGKPRLCASVGASGQNTIGSIDLWSGALETKLSVGGTDQLSLDDGSSSEVEPYESDLIKSDVGISANQAPVTDYLVFSDTVSGQPQDDISLEIVAPRFRGLYFTASDSNVPTVQIDIAPDQWKNVATGGVESTATCSGS